MKIYLIETNDTGWDTFDSGVVVAGSSEEAIELWNKHTYNDTTIKSILEVGTAIDEQLARVICASFNAG